MKKKPVEIALLVLTALLTVIRKLAPRHLRRKVQKCSKNETIQRGGVGLSAGSFFKKQSRLTRKQLIDRIKVSFIGQEALQSGRRLANIPRKGVKLMRITLHIGKFTVTIIVKSNYRHSAK